MGPQRVVNQSKTGVRSEDFTAAVAELYNLRLPRWIHDLWWSVRPPDPWLARSPMAVYSRTTPHGAERYRYRYR